MRPILICLCGTLLLVSCGLKGPLYLPDKTPEPQAVPAEQAPELDEQSEDKPVSAADRD